MSQRAADVFACLEAVAYPMFVLQDGRILWANSAATFLTGHTVVDLGAMKFAELLSPASREAFGTSGAQGEFELQQASGDLIWVSVALRQSECGGEPVDVATVTNIHERKLTESAQFESERRYRALLDQSNDCVSLFDLNGYYLLVNEQMASRVGYTPDEMVGMHLNQIIAPGEVDHYHDRDRALKAGENVPLFERTYRRRDGTQFQGEVNVSLVRDSDGTPLYVQSIMRDVTWRIQTEKALRASEERYRIISELISDYAYAYSFDEYGTLIHEWITDSFTRMTGYTNDEIDAKGPYALYYPGEEARVDADIQRVMRGETASSEYRILTKDGLVRWVHIFRQPVWDEKLQRVTGMYGVAQDITKRKQSEEELRQSEEKYRLIAENASDMISRTDADDIRTYVSSACRPLLGYEPEELIGQPSYLLIHPDDVARMNETLLTLRETRQTATFTCRMLHKNGTYIWFEVTGKAIFDPDTGEVAEYLAVSRDITQRRQMDAILLEQERLRFELQTEQELNEVKSNLMRTISHEFRTPLTLIVTATDFLDTYFDRLDAERRRERLQGIRVQVKRLSDMLDDISFVVQGTLHHMLARPARINLEAYARNVLEEIQSTIGSNHRFAFTTDGQLQEGVADKALVIRIIGNLLSNAVKYSPENSLITLSLVRDSSDAVIQVSDQGIGIDPEEQRHIFEPFYRGASVLDEIGGTGLGLSIVKDCVDLQGGSISLESTLGSGTTFTVRLPQTLLS